MITFLMEVQKTGEEFEWVFQTNREIIPSDLIVEAYMKAMHTNPGCRVLKYWIEF